MEAEDAFHEAFMKVFNHIDQYQGGSLEGWMRRIFVNTCINYYHKGKNRYLLEDITQKDYLVADFPDVLSQMSADHIHKLINELPTGARVVFNLFVIEGYAHKEIAEMLKLSEGTTKSQLNRAKELLRDKILVTT
jgi:RNA polymerase sigma-70 factor (ECF subfamily)